MDADHTWVNSSLCDVCILRNGAKAQAILISGLQESDRAEYMFICEQMDTCENWKCTISLGTCFPYPWQHNQNLSLLLVFDGLGKNGLLMKAQWHYFLAWGLGSLRSAVDDIVLIPSFSEVHKLPWKFDMFSQLTYNPQVRNGCSPLPYSKGWEWNEILATEEFLNVCMACKNSFGTKVMFGKRQP